MHNKKIFIFCIYNLVFNYFRRIFGLSIPLFLSPDRQQTNRKHLVGAIDDYIRIIVPAHNLIDIIKTQTALILCGIAFLQDFIKTRFFSEAVFYQSGRAGVWGGEAAAEIPWLFSAGSGGWHSEQFPDPGIYRRKLFQRMRQFTKQKRRINYAFCQNKTKSHWRYKH